MQIRIHADDRDHLRFLWFNSSAQLKIFRHAFLVFGLTCSLAILECVIQEHLTTVEGENPVIDMLKQNMYVDNVLTGYKTEEEAKVFKSSIRIFAAGGFNLLQWISNSSELHHFINEEFSKAHSKDSSHIKEDLNTVSS